MEIKNCSIYPRYEESLPKMSRIPEFALFMYHRHGKSNRVKCLPHSNGQALRVSVTPDVSRGVIILSSATALSAMAWHSPLLLAGMLLVTATWERGIDERRSDGSSSYP